MFAVYFIFDIYDLQECPVATNLKDKFASFLAEGLLDPLLPNILIQPEQDSEVKVSEYNS